MLAAADAVVALVDRADDRLVGFAFAVMQGAAVSGYSGFEAPASAVAFTRELTAIATPKYLPHLGTPFRD